MWINYLFSITEMVLNKMKVLIVFSSFLYICLALPQQHGIYNDRIMGGNVARNGSAPYQISFRNIIGTHFCGGSILNKRWILTAAHCLERIEVDNTTIYAGSNSLYDFNAHLYKIEAIIMHKDYALNVDHLHYADIGLVKVKTDIIFTELMKPVKLSKKHVKGGEVLKVTGWGSVIPEASPSRILQELYTTTITDKECQDRTNLKPNSQLCVLEGYFKGMCNGDSGSPLVNTDGEQVAIASFIFETCGAGHPDICTRVADYIDWIEDHIQDDK